MYGRDIPYRPKLEGDFRTRFYQKVSVITQEYTGAMLEKLCDSELFWVENECTYNLEQRKKYRAIWLLLRDLIHASWKAVFTNGVLMMRLPSVEEVSRTSDTISEAKVLLRKWMSDSRIEKLSAFAGFIEKMETDTATKKSIKYLIADGIELSEKLEKVIAGEIELSSAVKPYLELIDDSDPVDSYTGLRKADIWRYFRFMWSTPAESTPGRTMQYLIRDAAHPYHAVMGIASLENCAVAIACRDNHLGWTPDSFKTRIIDGRITPRTAMQMLLRYVNDGIDGVDYSDLCTEYEISNPTHTLIQRLQVEASAAEEERNTLFEKVDEDEDATGVLRRSEESTDLLFRRKRAEQLAKCLNARMLFSGVLSNPDFEENWERYYDNEIIGSAIRTALTIQKSKHIGSSILELNVCGAIPPYNEILGGKLVALLATSPQVVNDYRNRYSHRKSEIASKLKGSDVYRPAKLVYIGTSSLYSVGSSQYNRLTIPRNRVGNEDAITWKKYGKTTGFGTLHISRATTMSLKEATTSAITNRVNHVFGEGPSPKMRLLAGSIRELLETSADDTKEFTKHAMSRIVYGVDLVKNLSDYLLGFSDYPDYLIRTPDSKIGSEAIVQFWTERWLAHRIQYNPVFQRLREFKKDSILVSHDIVKDNNWEYEKLKEVTVMQADSSMLKGLTFVRSFYRGSSGYADYINTDLLENIHVQTSLDDAIIRAIDAGNDVILTGNPGDGKTHIIRIIKKKYENSGKDMRIVLDASTLPNNALYEKWNEARSVGVPFVVAINAAVLYSLHHDYPQFAPIRDAYNKMIKAVYFKDPPIDVSGTVVFDLSRRNIISKEILKSAIANLTANHYYSKCDSCPIKSNCGAQLNRVLLQDELFQERLFRILDRAALSGYHATLRDLQAFISYTIFGNRECNAIAKTNGNSAVSIVNLVYSGRGKMFDAIRQSFDPIQVSHPICVEKILRNALPSEGWIKNMTAPIESISPDRLKEFETRKRQFYFFHKDGKELLDILDDKVSGFETYLGLKKKKQKTKTIEMLNAFFGIKGDEELGAWSGHRFNNSSRKVLVSAGSLDEKDFDIGHPHLCPTMCEGMTMRDNYIRFELTDQRDVFLKIDFATYSLLADARDGVPVLYLNNSNVVRNIWRFMERLQLRVEEENEDESYVTVSLFDIEKRAKFDVKVDMEDRLYKSIQKIDFSQRGVN